MAGPAEGADGTFRQKIFWFREGYSWRRDPRPRLEITGQRVDSPASAPLKLLDVASNGWTNDAEHPFSERHKPPNAGLLEDQGTMKMER
jgi:hypothetical protein